MERNIKFLRGQVWMYNDPIYGHKKENASVKPNVSIIAYSRPVLIIQTTETIQDSAIVIPFTTNSKRSGLLIGPEHFNTVDTYAVIDRPFPVSVNQLIRYECTLSEEVMREYEYKLAELLGIKNPSTTAISNGITINKPEEQKPNSSDDPVINDPIINSKNTPTDIEDNNNWVPTNMPEVKDNGRRNWDKESILDYIKSFDILGPKKTMEIYQITAVSTTYTTYHRLKTKIKKCGWDDNTSKVESIEQTGKESGEESTASGDELIECTLDLNCIKQYVSTFANYMVRFAKDNKMDNYPVIYLDSSNNNSNRCSKNSFDTNFSASVYYSLLEYFGLKENNEKKLYFFKGISNKKLEEIDFLKKFSEMTNIVGLGSSQETIDMFIRTFPDTKNKIGKEWTNYLKNQLKSRFPIKDYAILKLLNKIESFICD